MTTGMPNSQMKSFLSSEEETNFLFWLKKVMVLTAERCSSYYLNILNIYYLDPMTGVEIILAYLLIGGT